MSQEHNVVGGAPPGAPHPAAHGHAEMGATRFETTDARASLVVWSLGIIAAILVGTFALTVGIQKFLYDENPVGDLPSPLAPYRILPPSPQIEVHPWESLPELRKREDKALHSSGKSVDGHQHVSIDAAIDAIVPKLKIRPDSPTAGTTPGGEGRNAPGTGDVNPAPRIEIKGGTPKHAQ